MAIQLDIVSFDEQIKVLPFTPIMLHDYDVKLKEEKARLNAFLMRVYTKDTLDITPQCSCGFLREGEWLGITCPKCSTTVSYQSEQDIRSTVWAKIPDGVEGFINPCAYMVLAKELKQSNFDTMAWLIDREYKYTKKGISTLKTFLEQQFQIRGLKRGLNGFIRHFDEIMEILFEGPTLKGVKNAEKVDDLKEFLRLHAHKFFSKYISFPATMMFIIESAATGRYADGRMGPCLNAVGTLTSIYHPVTPLTPTKVENWTAKVQLSLVEYNTKILLEDVGKKKGRVRRNLLGTQHPLTTRTVITSTNRRYDELEFPYAPFTLTMKEHIQSKRLHEGDNPQSIRAFVMENVRKWNPEMSRIHRELIADSPFGGIPCGFVRNPSLDRGSNQCLKIVEVKTDPKDTTMGLSSQNLTAYNADFDGDEMNNHIPPDNTMARHFGRLKAELGMMDPHRPFRVSNKLEHKPPVVSTINAWLNEDLDDGDLEPYLDEVVTA